jgi:hypothetical protein
VGNERPFISAWMVKKGGFTRFACFAGRGFMFLHEITTGGSR